MNLINDICESLITFSDLNIIHGNIKPSNIMIEDGHYRLMDYCKYMITDPFTLVSLINYEYLSPEQYKNSDLTIKTDMWNFGCIIYYIYTGTSPFASNTSDTITANVLNGNFKPISYENKNSMGLNELLSHLFVVNPEERYSPQEMLDAIGNMNELINSDDIQENNHKNNNEENHEELVVEEEENGEEECQMSCYNDDHTKILLPCSNQLFPIPQNAMDDDDDDDSSHLVFPQKPELLIVGATAPQPSIPPPIPIKPKSIYIYIYMIIIYYCRFSTNCLNSKKVKRSYK